MNLFFALLSLLAPAQVPAEATKPEAWVIIVDPGADLFTRFGHSAFLLREPGGDETIYDFGVFDFDAGFAMRFIRGTAKYYLDKRPLPAFLDSYMEERRSIRGHQLNLSARKVHELRDILEALYDSDERAYRYHHFSNNCATQMLLILSRLFKGDVQNELEKIPIVPWRTNLGTVLGEYTILNWGLRLILSSELDSARTAWTGSFLPYLLEKALLAVTVSEDPFAQKVPLIARSVTFYQGVNHVDRIRKPKWFYILIIVLGLILLAPLALRRRPFFLRLAFHVYGLFSGLIFAALFFLHLHLDICAYNLNMIAFFPFLLAGTFFMGRERLFKRHALVLLIIAAAFPVLQMVLRLFTIQRTAPFPEWVLGIHLLFIAEWTLVVLTRRHDQRLLVQELEGLSPSTEGEVQTPAEPLPVTSEEVPSGTEPAVQESQEAPAPKESRHGENAPADAP